MLKEAQMNDVFCVNNPLNNEFNVGACFSANFTTPIGLTPLVIVTKLVNGNESTNFYSVSCSNNNAQFYLKETIVPGDQYTVSYKILVDFTHDNNITEIIVLWVSAKDRPNISSEVISTSIQTVGQNSQPKRTYNQTIPMSLSRIFYSTKFIITGGIGVLGYADSIFDCKENASESLEYFGLKKTLISTLLQKHCEYMHTENSPNQAHINNQITSSELNIAVNLKNGLRGRCFDIAAIVDTGDDIIFYEHIKYLSNIGIKVKNNKTKCSLHISIHNNKEIKNERIKIYFVGYFLDSVINWSNFDLTARIDRLNINGDSIQGNAFKYNPEKRRILDDIKLMLSVNIAKQVPFFKVLFMTEFDVEKSDIKINNQNVLLAHLRDDIPLNIKDIHSWSNKAINLIRQTHI